MSKPNADLAIPLTADRKDPFTPEILKGTPLEAQFVLLVPTPSERDLLSSRLYELGLKPVNEETVRAHMVNELFEIDWAANGYTKPGQTNEQYADDVADWLDGYWIRNEADARALDLWTEQEGQRLLDEAAGVLKDPAPIPSRSVSVREHSRANILIDTIQELSPKIRALIAKRMDFGARNALLIFRLHVLEIHPKKGGDWPKDLKIERDAGGLLTGEFSDRLRTVIGRPAYSEIVNRCDSHYTLSGAERKNSGSPQGKPSDQTGSPEQSGDSANSGGKSTDLSTGPAPAEE